jgi:hypothetical protein
MVAYPTPPESGSPLGTSGQWLNIETPIPCPISSFSSFFVSKLALPAVYTVEGPSSAESPAKARIQPVITDIRAYVVSEARKAGVNVQLATWIVSHESQWHPGQLGDESQSRGLWHQQNLPSESERSVRVQH